MGDSDRLPLALVSSPAASGSSSDAATSPLATSLPHRRRRQSSSPATTELEPITVVAGPGSERTHVVIPTKPADWESVKGVIEELYLDKNVRLKDVMEIMQAAYKFRATARMYKAQFAKWNWHKYSTSSTSSVKREPGTSPTGSSSTGSGSSPSPPPKVGKNKKKKGTARVFVVNNNIIHKNLLETNSSKHLTTTMSACRAFIVGWSEQDPRWRSTSSFTKMGGHYDPTMISHFVAALNEFKNKDFASGGRLLRGAFLGLEDLISDGHVAALWDCYVTIPQLTLNHDRRDILLTFLRYLSRLTAARVPGHPIAVIARSTLAFVEHLDNFSDLAAYTTLAWNLWSDTIVQLLGKDNISSVHTDRAYLLIQAEPDPLLAKRIIDDYDRLVDKAMATLGEDSTTALALEYDALLTQMRFSMLDGENFQGRLERVLYKLTHKPDNVGMRPVDWASAEDRQIYRGSWFLCTVYAEDVLGDGELAREWRVAFLNAPADGDWVQMALRMEERLRSKGLLAEADAVRARRTEVQLPRKIVEILDREEREASSEPVDHLSVTTAGMDVDHDEDQEEV
ncbi:hypothetical protein B0H66DRAFT_546650 [Apodospora peruviana]|uniref:Clr5 domain-containing protein n=1 Tax=Apodospora peruviana TaxID=516989 RepID=A0AAE0MGA9_9PEZI|nr:hypothetical protein B0H66DRAFT_546650 [Apodospora peruviana]